ncbi:hypothetical protein BZG36_00612 [Bifiguratus adelaidae]|uniref:Mid2 domain-containing protein n=1 Tax=Bifiguratus adelaidae TaxID=1938954 RepID=A0A261Y778_9FUNG|nr:hypothetical protein BZG36_00612 [Bifiguratus adelaidae]
MSAKPSATALKLTSTSTASSTSTTDSASNTSIDAVPTLSQSVSSNSTNSTTDASSQSTSSNNGVVGGIIGAVIFFSALLFMAWLVLIRKRKKNQPDYFDDPFPIVPPYGGLPGSGRPQAPEIYRLNQPVYSPPFRFPDPAFAHVNNGYRHASPLPITTEDEYRWDGIKPDERM